MEQVQTTWQDTPAHWPKEMCARQQVIEEVVEWLELLRDGDDDEERAGFVQQAIDELRDGKPDKAIAKLKIWADMAYEASTESPELLAARLETSVEMALGYIEIDQSICERLYGWIRALQA